MTSSGNAQVGIVVFSDELPFEDLSILHARGFTVEISRDLQELFKCLGVERIEPVYNLKPEEIVDDRYGFARKFKLFFESDITMSEALEILEQSSLVKKAERLGMVRAF